MLDVLNGAYLWIKALHVISVIAWMAGIFYLPRLFVYHCEAVPGSAESERFKLMERKLLKIIINPAMIATWIFGLTLSVLPASGGVWHQPWFHAKFALVLAMSGFHGFLARWTREFAQDRNTHSARYYRIANEVPTVLMIFIVILVIVRPF